MSALAFRSSQEPLPATPENMRALLCQAMSGYSEERWCAGWMSGLEDVVRTQGGPWTVLAYLAGGWPQGPDGRDGTDGLTPGEASEAEAFLRQRLADRPMPTDSVAVADMVYRARQLARRAHEGQTDKAGKPYVDAHVADVAARVSPMGPLAEAVAWLHDVVEDTEVTLDDLRGHFPTQVVDAVDALTRRQGEHPDDYYRRVKANPTAALVKVHGDIPSNLDPARLARLPEMTRDRLERKYVHAITVILS